MRRILVGALALALYAQPAFAVRGLLVTPQGIPTTQAVNAWTHAHGVIIGVLDKLGCDYDVVPQNVLAQTTTGPAENLNQNCMRTGLVRYGVGTGSFTRQYGYIIHEAFVNGAAVSGANLADRTAGYNPDSLTLIKATTGWPTIPNLFIGNYSTSGGSLFSSSAACSTGVTGTLTAFAANVQTYSIRDVEHNLTWRSVSHAYTNAGANGLTILAGTPGITRARLIIGASCSGRALDAADGGMLGSCPDPDSMSAPASTYATPLADTAIMWTRETGFAGKAPLIWGLPLYMSNGGQQTPAIEWAMMIAIADSFTNRKIIGVKPGWSPFKIGFAISGAFTHSQPANGVSNSWDAHGYQLSTVNDSTQMKQGIVLFDALNVPVLVSVNIDSVGDFVNEKSWWAGLHLATFTPESRIGTAGTGATPNYSAHSFNTSRFASPDVFGYRRARSLISDDRYNYGTPCDTALYGVTNGRGVGDTCLSCILEYTRLRLDSIPEFRGRGSHTMLAPWGDYMPSNFNRGAMTNPDTLVAAFLRAGYTSALQHIMSIESNPGAAWGRGASGDVTPAATAPWEFSSRVRVQRVRGFGDFHWNSFRFIDEDNSTLATVHDISNEFLTGVFTPLWYNADIPYWYHSFKTPLNVFVLRAGDLGARSTASTTNVSRVGYYMSKWIVNSVRSLNAFDGRTVGQFVSTDDL